jgi:hypothetical protein
MGQESRVAIMGDTQEPGSKQRSVCVVDLVRPTAGGADWLSSDVAHRRKMAVDSGQWQRKQEGAETDGADQTGRSRRVKAQGARGVYLADNKISKDHPEASIPLMSSTLSTCAWWSAGQVPSQGTGRNAAGSTRFLH